MKKCKICKELLDTTQFEYPRSWRCKNCHKLKDKISDSKYRMVHRDELSTYWKIWYENNKEHRRQDNKNKEAATNWKKNNNEKVKAHGKVRYALKTGALTRSTICLTCGKDNVFTEAHHPNYNYPLNVLWVCKTCHKRMHGNGIYLQSSINTL